MEGQARRLLQARQGRAARLGLADRDVGRRARGRAHPADGRGEHPRALRRRPRAPDAPPGRRQAADGDDDAPHRGGQFRWSLTLFPTHAYAAEADMSLADYEDFFYRACLCDRDDPVEAWREQSEETRRLAEWITGKEEIHIEGPGTDLRLNVSGRTFIAADGRHNMPDGEFFTGPGRGLGHRPRDVHLPGRVRRARGGRREAALRGRQDRRRLRRAQRGLPDQDARHRSRARAGSASSASAPTTGSTASRRRSCSTRRSAARSTSRSACPIPRPAARTTPPCTGTWSATCAGAGASPSTASRSRWTASSPSRKPLQPEPARAIRHMSRFSAWDKGLENVRDGYLTPRAAVGRCSRLPRL